MRAVIRPFEPRDADGVVALLHVLLPEYVQTTAGFLHSQSTEPPRARARRLVAVSGDEVVGWCYAGFNWAIEATDVGEIWIGIHPERRDDGIGSRLYELGDAHVREHGARKLESWAREAAGHRFLEARGLTVTRSTQHWSVDPRTVDVGDLPALEVAKAREGFRLASLGDLQGRERDVYSLYAAAEADMPADEPETNLAFDEWTAHVLEHPDLSRNGSFVVLAGDQPASLAFIEVNREQRKAGHDLTGTLREFRRRGLARLAKLAAIRWCAENGITSLVTANDTTNADMLALNEHLGYRRTAVWTSFAKTV